MSFNANAREFVPRFGAAEFVPRSPAPVAASTLAPEAESKTEEPVENWDEPNPSKPNEAVQPEMKEEKVIEQVTKKVKEVEISSLPKEKVQYEVHDKREHLSIVFIGHVDAGKSTISGNLL